MAALECPDGLEVLCHQPGDGGLAGAGVAGEDHVHRKAGRLHARSGAALLDLQIVGQTEHVFLDWGQTDQLRDLGPDLIQRAGVGGGQQVEQRGRGGVVQAEEQALRCGDQGHGAGERLVRLQAVFAQSAEDAVAAAGQPGCALLGGALGGDVVPHIGPGGEGQAQPGRDLLGQRVQLLGGEGCKVCLLVGGRLTDVAQRRDHACAELVRHGGAALVREEDEVLPAGVETADRAGGQGRSGVHQNAVPVDDVPTGERGAAPDGQIGQRFQKAGAAVLVVLKDHDLAGGVERGVEVLQKELFGGGVRVKRQVERGDLVVLQQAPHSHTAGGLLQREVPPGAGAAAQQDDVPGGGRFGAQHKGAAHGADDRVHKGVLPQHGLPDFVGQPLEAAQMFGFHVGGAFGQQAVILHVPQHPAAVGQCGLGGGVLRLQLGRLGLEHRIQLLLLFQKRRVQVVQSAVWLLPGFGGGAGGGFEFAARPEDSIHQGLPIICICHVIASVIGSFLSV